MNCYNKDQALICRTMLVRKTWSVLGLLKWVVRDVFTFVLDLWLGSSLECKSPAPKDGNWVWNTEIRPPVGDISLNAAWRAGPNALCVSLVLVNIFGNALSRSFISCRTDWKVFYEILQVWDFQKAVLLWLKHQNRHQVFQFSFNTLRKTKL